MRNIEFNAVTKEITIIDTVDDSDIEIAPIGTEQKTIPQPTIEELQQQIIELQEQVIILLGV